MYSTEVLTLNFYSRNVSAGNLLAQLSKNNHKPDRFSLQAGAFSLWTKYI